MVHRIAHSLLIRVYHAVSAVLSLDQNGGFLDVCLFDTQFAGEWMRVHPDAKQVCLISNHPEGQKLLYEQDVRNIMRLKEKIGDVKLRVFISGEDIGVTEMSCENEMLRPVARVQ